MRSSRTTAPVDIGVCVCVCGEHVCAPACVCERYCSDQPATVHCNDGGVT